MPVRARLREWVVQQSEQARHRRGQLFVDLFAPTERDAILDLGSEEGDHIAAIVPFRANVTIADIDPESLARGAERHGFQTATLDESGRLPFADDAFDVVFCSSVIEHVTTPKEGLSEIRSKADFERAAFARQREFADEIRRISRRYYVQTPSKWFPIESHSWLPMPIVLLPRPAQIRVTELLDRFWIKRTEMDWNLLTASTLAELFPDAEIRREKVLGLTKSIIAVRR